MSRLKLIEGDLQDDHLCLVVNSGDSFVNVSIDSFTGTEDFKRSSHELDIKAQKLLIKKLQENIDKWENV